MVSIERIGEVNIRKFYLNDAPYIKLGFSDKKLTDIQKELIYRIYFLSFVKEDNPSYREDSTQIMIRLVLSKKYNELYNIAKFGGGIIGTYMVSNSLVEDSYISDIPQYESDFVDDIPVSYYNHYISLIDMSIIEKRFDVFVVPSFAEYIKYSNDFIDSNFKEFLIDGARTSFPSIMVQKPPYDILVKHIEDISMEDISSLSYLTEEQFETLKLLKSMDLEE